MRTRIVLVTLVMFCWYSEAFAGGDGRLTLPDAMEAARAYVFNTCPVTGTLDWEMTSPIAVFPPRGTEPNEGDQIETEAASALEVFSSVVVEPVMDTARGLFAAWLEERAKARSTVTTAVGVGMLRPMDTLDLPCLAMVHGKFSGQNAEWQPDNLEPADINTWDWPDAWLRLFQLKEKPRLYIELMIKSSPDGNAIQLEPRLLDLRRGSVVHEDIHLALTAHLALRGTSIGSVVVPLPSPVPNGIRLTPNHLVGHASPWLALPRPVDQQTGRLDNEAVLNAPISVLLAMVESVQPSTVEKLMAVTFGAVRQPALPYDAGKTISSLNGSTEGRLEKAP